MSQIKKDTSLRKAILQAAITGQLISDVEGTTETGKELLGRIIEERNKKLLAEWEEKQTDLFASNDAHLGKERKPLGLSKSVCSSIGETALAVSNPCGNIKTYL